MTAMTILMSAVLIILIFVQMHNSMRIEERREEMEELFDKSNQVISKFDSVFADMEENNKSYSAVINRITELRKENGSLLMKNQMLIQENTNLEWNNQNLKSSNRKLTKRNNSLNEKQGQYEQAIANYQGKACDLIDSIEDLKRTKSGLEIIIKGLPAEEITFLSKPIASLGLKKLVIEKLSSSGIHLIGELVRHSEQSLLRFDGVSNRSLDSINSALSANCLQLGMEITCIDGRWYHLNNDNIEE